MTEQEMLLLRGFVSREILQDVDGGLRRAVQNLLADYSKAEVTARLVYSPPMVRDELVKKMADAWCGWPIPKNFSPDFSSPVSPHNSGTNILTWEQAKDMFNYCIDKALGLK